MARAGAIGRQRWLEGTHRRPMLRDRGVHGARKRLESEPLEQIAESLRRGRIIGRLESCAQSRSLTAAAEIFDDRGGAAQTARCVAAPDQVQQRCLRRADAHRSRIGRAIIERSRSGGLLDEKKRTRSCPSAMGRSLLGNDNLHFLDGQVRGAMPLRGGQQGHVVEMSRWRR
jgi:hypothetical protein